MHRRKGQVNSRVVSRPESPLNLNYCGPKGNVPPRFVSKPAAIQPSTGRFASAWAAIQAAQPSPAAEEQHRSDNYFVSQHSPQQGYNDSELDDGASSAPESDFGNSSQPLSHQPRHPGRIHQLHVSLPIRIGRSSSDDASSAPEQHAASEARTPRNRQGYPGQHGTEHSSAPADKKHGQIKGSHSTSPSRHQKQHWQSSRNIPPAGQPQQRSFWDMQSPGRSLRDIPRRARSEQRAAMHLRTSPQAVSSSPQPRYHARHAKQLARASSDSLSDHSIRQNPIYSPEVSRAILMPADTTTSGGASAKGRRPVHQKRANSRDGSHGRRDRGPAQVPQVVGKGPRMRENAVFGSPWSSFGSEGELEGMRSQALHMPRCSG